MRQKLFCRRRAINSARRLSGESRDLVGDGPRLASVSRSARPEGEVEELRKHIRTGRPLGDEAFWDRLEGLVEHVLAA